MDMGGAWEGGCNTRTKFGLGPVREDGEKGQKEERRPVR